MIFVNQRLITLSLYPPGRSTHSIGAGSDSFYEYLLKTSLLFNETDFRSRMRFAHAVSAILNNMTKYNGDNLPFLFSGGSLSDMMEELSCFFPGTLALAVLSPEMLLTRHQRRTYAVFAKALTHTCRNAFAKSKSGLAPDEFVFPGYLPFKNEYLLRPETFESYYYLWTLTHDPKYRDWAWDAVLAINSSCRTKYGFSEITVVNQPRISSGTMPSYFLAETLKYLYLIFLPDDEAEKWGPKHFIYNTEAHLLLRDKAEMEKLKRMYEARNRGG